MDRLNEILYALAKDLVWCVICVYHLFIQALPTIVVFLGFIYVCLQITYIIWKWRIEKEDREKQNDHQKNK